MGQAASMCRFRGCRYKKNKNNTENKANSNSNNNSNSNKAHNNSSSPSSLASGDGLHLRSIEEPAIQYSTSSHHSLGRMPAEQGGTGYGSETNLLGSRTGVPLQQLQNAPYSPTITTTTTTMTTTQLPKLGYDPEYARMEAWMDEHQEFVQDYFIRKATRQVVDAWLVSHATSAGNDVAGSPTHASNGQNCSSRGGSGATTPVRKISAHEFERGGLLKPIVNTIDGTPTFLSVGTTQNDCLANNITGGGGSGCSTTGGSIVGSGIGGGVGGGGSCSGGNGQYHHNHHSHNNHHPHHHHHHNHQTANGHNYHRPQRLSRNELKQLDEKELIFELVKDICNELEIRTLCHKILQNVSILLNADRGSLFLVQGRCNGSDGPKKCLVSKLFDVCPRSTVEEMEQREEVRVAWGTGIAGHVAESGEPVNIPDAYQDERFNNEIDSLTGYHTKTLLCMPIKDSSGDVIGVAQVINKLNGECFSEIDEKVFASYLQFCGIGLRNAQLYEKSQLEIKRNQVLLDLARMIFEEQSTIEHMVFRILSHMQSLIQCQRVQILLVHEASKGSFSRVFDFEANDLSAEDSVSRTSPFESRFPINIGITGHAATTGETVNIPNAYEDDRFDPSVDESSNFKHKSILCMAIKNSLGQIIGVIQLINKFDDLNFSKNDENFVEAFAIFCGMGIHNTHMYEKAIVAMAKQSVTLEVLSYHASATIDEAHRLRRLRVPSAAHFRLHDFKFDDIHFEDDDTLKACLRMFLDLDFVERFHIDYEVLCRWLLSVKKNYRNVTYHNWRHAFNVAQMMFAILTATQWWKIFGEIECLALIIACLCHDLDHRGTNNSFQIKASSPLAQLYSTSTMEHHHFDQCLMILNSPGNQILANLSSDDYCRVIRVLEDAILSTDLAVYFRKRGPFLKSVQDQPMSYWVDDEPRALLRAMSMTVCDLSAITKPWAIEKRVADLVSSEFFEQGDMEKEELNITPIDIMNREKEDELPMMQVGFIESICMPIYEAFATLSDKLEPLVEGVRDNRQHWIEMAEEVQKKSKLELKAIEAAPKSEHNPNSNTSSNSHSDTNNTTRRRCNSSGNSSNAENTDCSSDTDNISEDGDTTATNNYEAVTAADTDALSVEDIDDDNSIVTVNAEDGDDEHEDDGDDVCILQDDHHSRDHSASSGSSRLSTSPPTGEGEDSSTPNSPAKLMQAKIIVANLKNLNRKSLKVRCKSCEQARQNNNNNIRKASSLKGPSELQQQQQWQNGQNDAGCCSQDKNKSKSTSSINAAGGSSCGTQRQQQQQQQQEQQQQQQQQQKQQQQQQHQQQQHYHHNQYQHQHQHHHHLHQFNHSHHHHHYHHHYGSPTSNGGESDKIPRIVGKLGNLDSMRLYAVTAGTGSASSDVQTNMISFLPNGQFSIRSGSSILTRRHSETNGLVTTTALCEK